MTIVEVLIILGVLTLAAALFIWLAITWTIKENENDKGGNHDNSKKPGSN